MTIATIISQPVARTLVKILARDKKAASQQFFEKAREEKIPEQEMREALDWLESQRLIEKQAAPISDFDTYYITADGLAADRTLDRIEPNGKSLLSRILGQNGATTTGEFSG